MMKKNFKKYLLLTLVISLVALPYNASAQTLKDFENEVAKYTAELQAKQDKVAKNDAEVAEIKKKIANIESQITEAENEIKRLEDEIDKSNKEIENKKEQSKKIMKYFQIMRSGNTYLEYIFEAESVTDMIYRISVVEQLTEYNQKVVNELNQLIKDNNEKKQQLKNKQAELDKLKSSLQSEKERINADTAAIKETMPTVEEQIKSAKENVSYLKKIGCGSNEDVQRCINRVTSSSSGSLPSTGNVKRPTTTGRRNAGVGGYPGHIGQDIGSSNKRNETIYPIADGTIFYVGHDNCNSRTCSFQCNGNANIVVIKHNISGVGTVYATYAHMSSVSAPSSGFVSVNTPIGQMGDTGCTSGSDPGGRSIHLHLEISRCHWRSGGGCTWAGYQRNIISPSSIVTLPSSWSNR